jgi:hypothetical protein
LTASLKVNPDLRVKIVSGGADWADEKANPNK